MRWRRTLNQRLKSGEEKLMNAEVGNKGPVEMSATTPTVQRPHTNETFAAKIVSPTSISTATSDAATIRHDNYDQT